MDKETYDFLMDCKKHLDAEDYEPATCFSNLEENKKRGIQYLTLRDIRYSVRSKFYISLCDILSWEIDRGIKVSQWLYDQTKQYKSHTVARICGMNIKCTDKLLDMHSFLTDKLFEIDREYYVGL